MIGTGSVGGGNKFSSYKISIGERTGRGLGARVFWPGYGLGNVPMLRFLPTLSGNPKGPYNALRT